jgi:hypothetical protein
VSSLQGSLLGWAATQPVLTGILVLGAGLVYAFFGFHFFRFLLAVTCAGLGYFGGALLSLAINLPDVMVGTAGALALGLLALKWPKLATGLATGAVWAILGHYLASQVHLPTVGIWVAAGIAGMLGIAFSILSPRTMALILPTLQGVVLLVVGFVIISTNLVPSVGFTFRDWANTQSLLVPIFLTMLFVAGYSYQAMHARGDIRTGR